MSSSSSLKALETSSADAKRRWVQGGGWGFDNQQPGLPSMQHGVMKIARGDDAKYNSFFSDQNESGKLPEAWWG
jgi:hypothetical protein